MNGFQRQNLELISSRKYYRRTPPVKSTNRSVGSSQKQSSVHSSSTRVARLNEAMKSRTRSRNEIIDLKTTVRTTETSVETR